jgi:ATP-binding cassette, subfamily B, bacterial MsbA
MDAASSSLDTEASAAGRPTVASPAAAPAAAPASETAQAPGPATLPTTARRFIGVLWPQRAALLLGMTAFLGAAALEPLAPALLQRLLDAGFPPAAGFPLWIVPACIVGLFALRGLLGFSGAYLFAWATSKAVLELRRRLVAAIVKADATVFTWLSPGVAAARVINDPQNATAAISSAMTTVLKDGTSLVAMLGYLFVLNWRLALASLLSAPLLALAVRRVQRRVVKMGERTYASQIRLTGIIDDIARAWRVVRTFDAGAFEQQRFDGEAQHLRRSSIKSAAAGALMTPLTQVVASLGVALIVTLALLEARHGGMTVGQFVAFVTALLMTVSPLRHLTDVTQPIVGGLIQARACFELIDTPPEPDPGTVELPGVRAGIRCIDATVHYDGAERPALDRLSVSLPAGTTIAFVGASGAGKSTLVNTLLGFVRLSSGQLLFDGLPVETIRRESLRRQFAVVSQDIVLFDGTIEDNVAYAQPLDAERVRACLDAAQLTDFVRGLPDGVQTRVGTNGARLSGGQRQRLAIARALYKDAPVWVFDEATSALDSAAEQAVHHAIARWRGHRTLVLIAHRLSTVRDADCIHVLSDGRLAESGRHGALMASNGLYAAMVRAQTLD